MIKKIRILVAGGSEIWRKILIRHIGSSSDMEIAGEISSGQGSILMLDEVDPDVVMLDVSLDERMSPKDIVSQIKTIKPDVRIILCVDKTRTESFTSTFDLDVTDFITKPYTQNVVLRSVYRCMKKPAEE